TATIEIAMNNTGTVEVQVGTLNLTGGGTASGSFTLLLSTTLNIGSNYTLAGGANVVGTGTLQVPTFETLTVTGPASVQSMSIVGGTVTANDSLAVNALTFASGTVNGPGTVTVNGILAWSGGTMSGPGTTVLSGSTGISATSAKIDGRTINNVGTTNMAVSSSLSFQNA